MRKVVTENQPYLLDWFRANNKGKYPDGTACIGVEKDGELIGMAAYNNVTPVLCQFHVTSKTPYWVTRDLLYKMFDYPFNKLKVKVILAPICKDNEKSLNFGRKLGFRQVADIPYAHPDGDLIVMAMKRDQCKWLQQGEGNECSS